jgi:hypothetical protein
VSPSSDQMHTHSTEIFGRICSADCPQLSGHLPEDGSSVDCPQLSGHLPEDGSRIQYPKRWNLKCSDDGNIITGFLEFLHRPEF